MAEIERLTVTLAHDMAAVARGAVETGDYASSSEVVREALRDWKRKRAQRLEKTGGAQGGHRKGPDRPRRGPCEGLSTADIIDRGRKLLAARSPSPYGFRGI